MNVLALIPARGGSKGLPGKNIRLLAGKPLLAYSIESALRCPHITRVVVSTDSPAIADVALRYGADVPFLRPSYLSGDKADLGQALNDTIRRLEAMDYVPDVTMVFFPTSPFRSDGLVRFLLERLLEGHASVATTRILPRIEGRLFTSDTSGRLCPLPETVPIPQPLPMRSYGILGGNNPRGTLGPYFYPITDPFTLVDIDTFQDFHLAEKILEANLFDFTAEAIDAPPTRTPPPEKPSPLSPGLGRWLLGTAPTGERLVDRDVLRQALDQDRDRYCRNLAAPDLSGRQNLQALAELARLDPGNPALATVIKAALAAPAEALPLSRLLAQPDAMPGQDWNNLLATAGLIAHSQRLVGRGLELLRAVRWEQVTDAPFFLSHFFAISNSSLAADRQAKRLIVGLLPQLQQRAATDIGIQLDLGVACAHCGLAEEASALLSPLLPESLSLPERLLRILSALAWCGGPCRKTAQRFFTRSAQDRLIDLDYDANQRNTLASLLTRLGLPRPARRLMTALAENQEPVPDRSLAALVYGLFRVGRAGLARRLMDAATAHPGWAGDPTAVAALVRARLCAGQPDKARQALATVDASRLDTPLLTDTFMTLFERARDIDRLLALCRQHYSDDRPPTPADFGHRFAAALWSHTLPRLLTLALAAPDNLRSNYVFAYWLHHTALWAGDAATATAAADTLAAMPEAHAINVHLLTSQALLLKGRNEQALEPLAARCRTITPQAMNMEHLEDIWQAFFDRALVLRHLGRRDEALAVLESCRPLEDTPHNACRGLRLLLSLETSGAAPCAAAVRLLLRLAKAQTAQRSLISPWLILQAIRLAKGLGDHAGAARLLRTHLARDPLLDPNGRQALADIPLDRPDVGLRALVAPAQAAFYPYHRGGFWNEQLAADLEVA